MAVAKEREAKNDGAKARYWEMCGKALGHLKDDTNINLGIFAKIDGGDVQQELASFINGLAGDRRSSLSELKVSKLEPPAKTS